MNQNMNPQKIQIINREGKSIEGMLESVTFMDQGHLSARYKVKINEISYFMKTFLNSKKCAGSSSRNIIRNEILIQREFVKAGLPTYYRGFTEIDGRVCILFEYLGNVETLQSKIEVNDTFEKDEETNTTQDVLRVKRKVEAQSKNIFKLEEVIEIITKVTEQAQIYHQFKTQECEGLIQGDISPSNIHIFVKYDELKVLLSDFGIARRMGKDIYKLFNETIPGRIRGNYYGAVSGRPLHPIIYSVPDIENYQVAEPSLDTYNVCNILCLMLTGKLAEYWHDKNKCPEINVPQKDTPMQEFLRQLTEHPTEKGGLYERDRYLRIGRIILEGTSPVKANRYQDAKTLLEHLQGLEIQPIQKEQFECGPIALNIPAAIMDYTFTQPQEPPMVKLYAEDLAKMRTTLEYLATVEHRYPQGNLLGNAYDLILKAKVEAQKPLTQKIEEYVKPQLKIRHPWLAVAGLATAVGLYGLSNCHGPKPPIVSPTTTEVQMPILQPRSDP